MTKLEIPLDKQCDWCGAPHIHKGTLDNKLCKWHYEAIGGR